MTDTAHQLCVAVIAGGLAHEREISLRSGKRLVRALKSQGHQVTLCDMDSSMMSTLDMIQPDVVWPMVHGTEGEGGSLQDLLDLLGWNYVGSTPEGCRISTAKPVAKSVVDKNGLRTPASMTLPQQLFQLVGATAILERIEHSFGLPVIVKPTEGGSALGITRAENAEQLRTAMVDAFAYGKEVLIEKFIEGREIAISIVDEDGPKDCVHPLALPAVEIRTDAGDYDYDARYNSGRTEFFCPADLNDQENAQMTQLALSCYRVLELRDLARIDMILDNEGYGWFIDANVIPGMTDMSLFPLAAQADKGFDLVIDMVTRRAAQR
ncbi:MAG: D-alanine--D-alanine ligase [Actinomycetaceae bacterium]|nr:D-alanine--D-alanine ligase [Actinomycetaceae bacterium]